MKKVLVYLATYNGEKYLKEQLDSILNQKNIDVHILISDDQSNDSTIQIIESYVKKHSNISLIANKKNVGYRMNFMNMIHADLKEEYDFFSFSDQDDVWLENKLERAVSLLEEYDEDTPLLYSSNLKTVDENLNFIKLMFSDEDLKTNEYQRFLENTATGCTCVFNNKLREKILKFPITELKEPHDEIVEKIAIATGKYIFDSESFILYRQHQTNQIGVNDKGKSKKHLDMLFGKTKMYHSYIASLIFDIYNEEMCSNEMKTFIYNIGKYRQKLSAKFKVLFQRKYKKSNFKKTILLKAAILFARY